MCVQMTPAKMQTIAKRLFLAGFLFLPFLWLVNAAFFRRYYKHPSTPESVKNCALRVRCALAPLTEL